MSAVTAANDSADLEALFDSIVAANTAPAPAEPAAPAAPAAEAVNDHDDVITRVGKLTRALHDGLRELGYDKLIESSVAAMPDTRDRLSYVATMTEQAAQRALNASEAAKPIQESLATGADALSARWDRLFSENPGVEEFKSLVGATREYLHAVPEQTKATSAQLTEIMLAQDFQDLTGQVIKKITDVVHTLEGQLVKLLVENAPRDKAQHANELVNGPVINGHGRSDVVTSQQQVDDLLESLGF